MTDPRRPEQAVEQAVEQAARAAAAAGVDVGPVTGVAEHEALAALLDRVWSAATHRVVELPTLVALAASGNLVCVARAGGPAGAVVGGGLGFLAPGGVFHSHVVGVDPGHAGRGVGLALKLHQRAWCLGVGADRMTWTYDPLVARNAGFNLARLGARPVAYLPHHYGPMRDGLNAGQDSDRVLVSWDLRRDPGPLLTAAPAGAVAVVAPHPDDEHRPVAAAVPAAAPADAPAALVAVPPDVTALRTADPDAARAWRTATRAAFTDLLGTGWSVAGFVAGSYVLLPDPDPDPEVSR